MARSHLPATEDDAFVPVPVTDLELTDPAATAPANVRDQILALVRLHGVPLGTLSRLSPAEPSSDTDLVAAAEHEFHDAIVDHLRSDGVEVTDALRTALLDAAHVPCAASKPSLERVSVIVCTLGEDPRLLQTVESILAQSHRALELVVVDNHPASGRVRQSLSRISDPRLRVVDEPRRGLSVARNTGLRVATTSWVAYTDDDAVADADWLRHLLAPAGQHPDVVCVTGLVLPAELSTPAQLWFEEFGAFDKGFSRRVWSTRDPDPDLARLGTAGERGPLFPYSAGVFGSGNNMAFRADWLRANGGFDEALGAGTLARGGEDLDAFLTVMLTDHVIVYEPAALVRHHARGEMVALRRQMYGYGSGMCAVVVKHLVRGPRSAVAVLARVPAGLRKLLDPASEKNAAKSTSFPRELVVAELTGYLSGPVLYARSRRRTRRGAVATAAEPT